jgi:hypothetical protein
MTTTLGDLMETAYSGLSVSTVTALCEDTTAWGDPTAGTDHHVERLEKIASTASKHTRA